MRPFPCSIGIHRWFTEWRSRVDPVGWRNDRCSRCQRLRYIYMDRVSGFFQPVDRGVCHLCHGTGKVEDADGGPVPTWGRMVECYHCDGSGKVND